MATSVVIGTEYPYPKGETFSQRRLQKFGTLAFSNANYFTGGAQVTFPAARTTNPVPVNVVLQSLKGSGYVYQWVNADLWPKNTAVAVGWAITDSNGNLQVCTSAGTTNNTAEPTWNINTGGTTPDNGATWTNLGISYGTVRILTGAAAQSPLTELTSGGAVPAAVLADTIEYVADYLRG